MRQSLNTSFAHKFKGRPKMLGRAWMSDSTSCSRPDFLCKALNGIITVIGRGV